MVETIVIKRIPSGYRTYWRDDAGRIIWSEVSDLDDALGTVRGRFEPELVVDITGAPV